MRLYLPDNPDDMLRPITLLGFCVPGLFSWSFDTPGLHKTSEL